MAKKIIPAVTIHTCDRCGAEYDDKKTTDFELTATLHSNHADHAGHYVGGNSKDIDLCGSCSETFANKFMKEGV